MFTKLLGKLNYPTAGASIFAFFSFFVALVEYPRIQPDLLTAYFGQRFFFGVTGFYVAWLLYKKPLSDLYLSLFAGLFMAYVLVNMWFAPLYEIAYVQWLIGCAFIPFKRRWIYSVISLLGLAGVLWTHHYQEQIQWKIASISYSDVVFSLGIFLILSHAIQRYALNRLQYEQSTTLRFSKIGKNATEILHDVKGLLASPLLLLEELKASSARFEKRDFENYLALLSQDLSKVHQHVRELNLMVRADESESWITFSEALENVKSLMGRRLQAIEIHLNEDRQILMPKHVVHSFLFNIMMNSVEAFTFWGTQDPKIRITWKGSDLGILTNSKPHTKAMGTGLGLELVEYELKALGAHFHHQQSHQGYLISIAFPQKRVRN